VLPAWKDFLAKPITSLKGIGDEKAQLFAEELGVRTLGDLVYLLPLRYVDKTQVTPIAQLKSVGSGDVFVRGVLRRVNHIGTGAKRRVSATLQDETGQVDLVWFRGGYYAAQSLKVGTAYSVFGKVNIFKNRASIAHPEISERAGANETFEPVYPSTEKFNSKGVNMKTRRRMVKAIVSLLEERFPGAEDTLPGYLREQYRLVTHTKALHDLHFPANHDAAHEATRRIKFEELFLFQMRQLWGKYQHDRDIKGYTIPGPGKIYNQFVAEKLPFTLTGAQQRVLTEVSTDLTSGTHMNRLIQGDVGSGKTIVALLAMLMAIDHGYQAVLMAPTQILAHQHFEGLTEMLKGTGVMLAFLTGSTKAQQRAQTLRALERGDLNIIIGTHALIEDPVVFKNLGLAVIDEQHRFGVKQRAKLWRKNKPHPPHVLVMTATPIPRTLALTTHAELDVSKIDELPPGRKPVTTRHIVEKHRSSVTEWMRSEVEKGRQIYVVYPLIEESEALDLKNVMTGFERIQERFPAPKYHISIVHGRLKAADKDFEMDRFVKGQTQIMVATTVIEVGVNVPNASVMVIENAERFGLSQLHQLRGRVGRGAEQSYCILMTDGRLSDNAKQRIKIMCETNDGFVIAEKDLHLRGAGDIEGLRQSGQMLFKLARIPEDEVILNVAHEEAKKLLSEDPEFVEERHRGLKLHMREIGETRRAWTQIS
jgi:ATP-dependent DNA helicase RecG